MKKTILFALLTASVFNLLPTKTEAYLVPCGNTGDPTTDPTAVPCQLCHVFVLFDNIVTFLLIPQSDKNAAGFNWGFPVVLVIAFAMMVWAGLMFMFAYMGGGGPSGINKAKALLTSILTGLLIVYGGWIVVNTILVAFDIINPSFGWDPNLWFQVDCPLTP